MSSNCCTVRPVNDLKRMVFWLISHMKSKKEQSGGETNGHKAV